MASALVRETMLVPTSNELDSECSSGGGDDRNDLRKRLRDDNDSTSPKKRRKQTTPVRFPASLMTTTNEHGDQYGEEEEDDDDDEQFDDNTEVKGKMLLHDQSESTKDENLNSEFRCQYCGNLFEDKEILLRHLEHEHGASNLTQSIILSPLSQNSFQGHVRVKLEQEEVLENPVNLSGLTIKNFTTSWLPGQTQAQDTDWTGQNTLSSVPNHLLNSPFSGSFAQFLSMPGFPMNDPGQLPRVPVGPTPVRIFNPDAYCELCNKEFCNKYFLKTHKANKHGVYIDMPMQGGSDSNGPTFPSVPVPASCNIKVEQRQDIPPPPPPSTTPTIPCRKHKQKTSNEPSSDQNDSQSLPAAFSDDDKEFSRSSPNNSESVFQYDYGIEQEDTKFLPAPRHLSPQSSQLARESGFNPEKLRKLGVMNLEAFCEICCKEYCNKYFLRTHKIKRHGLVIQDNDKSPGSSGTWHHIQTSPLNLMTTDNFTESNDKIELFECKICGLRFQTESLYQSHKLKMHDNDENQQVKQDDEERTDSISEDLQKLQTMILQLNGLESNKISVCNICDRECENNLALKTHMALEHGASEESYSPNNMSENPHSNEISTVCMICEKDFQSPEILKQHIVEEHHLTPAIHTPSNLPLIPTLQSVPLSAPPIPPPPDKKISSLTPTSSYCEICNKELCNKYFMKTHMQRMHGIEIENGSQIGGVICNICNKELCSKYFLRVHKHNTHGIIDEGAPPATAAVPTKPDNYESSNSDDAALKPEQLGDLSHRYFTHFTEVCPICNRRFRSIKWLKAHLLGDHSKAGVDKWRELELQYQNKNKSSNSNNRQTNPSNPPNLNLKIPNGTDISPQIKPNEYTGLGNQVLSSLFGGSEDQPTKNYRCSYCNFTTPVLPFLFLHEKSHSNNPENNINLENNLQCPVCSQTFSQPELLHHHVLTRHQLTGLMSQFRSPIINSSIDGSQEKNELDKDEGNDERSRTSPPQIQSRSETPKNKRDEPAAVQVTPQGAYKCAQCSYATANLNRIKKHVKKDHKALGDPTDSVIAELSKTLHDVANKHKVPATYAMPQDLNSNPDMTVMQPFIIEEQETAIGEESTPEKRFAPALVYLPVRSRVSNVLTASFTLSPA